MEPNTVCKMQTGGLHTGTTDGNELLAILGAVNIMCIMSVK